MDNEHKKRAWFQIHLSTAIILMFVAGFLIKINVQPREMQELGDQTFQREYGWPWVGFVETFWYYHGVYINADVKIWPSPPNAVLNNGWHSLALTGNLVVAIGLNLAAAFVSQSFILRANHRKERDFKQ